MDAQFFYPALLGYVSTLQWSISLIYEQYENQLFLLFSWMMNHHVWNNTVVLYFVWKYSMETLFLCMGKDTKTYTEF